MMTDHHASQRLAWADRVRGLCMMAILLFHTEKYYAGEEIIPYALYVNNALTTFFFISGYLFHTPEKPFSGRYKLLSVLRGIILPYFVFTALIALPKAWVHDDTSVSDTFLAILTGHASWFIAALAVAEVIFTALIIRWGHRPVLLGWVCALPYLLIAAASHFIDPDRWTASNLWCWQNAFIMLPFIYIGYRCRRSPKIMQRMCHLPIWITFLAIEVFIKSIVWYKGLYLTFQPIHVDSFALLLVDGICGALLIIAVCMRLPEMKWVEWTGAHSLIYYFICGGVPLVVTRVLSVSGLPYQGNYCWMMIAFVIVYLFSTAISFFILWFFQLKKKK